MADLTERPDPDRDKYPRWDFELMPDLVGPVGGALACIRILSRRGMEYVGASIPSEGFMIPDVGLPGFRVLIASRGLTMREPGDDCGC